MNKITREEWGARPPRFVPSGINTQSATNHWEGTTLGEFPHESCPTKVQVIQDFHMDSRGWSDIAYNFLVCPHGYVFVGRDHGVRSAANGTNEGNNNSEAVCYIGGPGDIFTVAGRSALHEINLEIGGQTFPHQHWFNTACPGQDIVEWLIAGQPVPAPKLPQTPTKEVQDMTPDFVELNGKVYRFMVGDDLGVWLRIDSGNLINLMGIITSGLSAKVCEKADAKGQLNIRVCGRGDDGAFWELIVDKDGNSVTTWQTFGGHIYPPKVG